MHKTVILQTLSCIHLSFHTVRAELLSDYIKRPLSASGMIDKNLRAKTSFFFNNAISYDVSSAFSLESPEFRCIKYGVTFL